eukprot:s3002_g14.t1
MSCSCAKQEADPAHHARLPLKRTGEQLLVWFWANHSCKSYIPTWRTLALPDSEGSATGDAAQASKKYGQTVVKLLSVFDQKGRWLANSVREDVSQQPLLVTAHQAFLQELRKQRLLDISEVIEAASRLQQADAESCSTWVASFAQMLFVDEWQDIDTEQQDFLARLCRQGHITAVGDDDQRIYAWRDKGASAPEAFRKHWSSACIKTLGANHRALPHLVEAATRLISHNSHREKKELRSARQEVEQSTGVSVVAKECLNAEARWVAEEIQRGDAKSFGAFAILTRTNASATIFAKALSQLGLPVWPSARKGVTDGPRTSQVLDLLAYLRLVVDPHHDPSFLRICNVPRRGVGKAALRCLREQFGAPAETSLSTFQGVEDLNVEQAALRARSLAGGVDGEPASGSFEGAVGRLLKAPWLGSNMRLAQGLAKLAAVLRAARRAAAAEHGAADVLRVILAETGLGSGGSGSAGATKAATGSGRKSESTEASPVSLQQLMAAAEKYADGQNGAACVVRFLQEMAPRGSGHAASTSSVFVSTIHQAKGLEWDTVFLVQCNEMVMPLQRQGMHMADEQLEEERRAWLQSGALFTPPDVNVAMMKRGGKPASSSEPFDDDFEKGQDEESPLLETSKPKPSGVRDGFGLGCYMQRLESSFGHELLIMLFVAQHLMKGFVNEFTAPCIAYLYRSYTVPGPQMQIYRGVSHLPWAMKPMIGLLSDAVPILGYNKSPYILLVAILGTSAMTTIGLVPKTSLSVTSLVFCLFLIQLQLSTTDLLTEAKYAEKMQTKPKEGPALMIGPILSAFGPKLPFLVTLVPASIVILPVLRGYMQEKRLTWQEVHAARSAILRQKEACILCVLMLAATMILSYFGTMLSVRANAMASISIAVMILLSFSILLRPEIAKVNTFFVLQTSVNFSIGGAAFYFYTDTKEQYPEGPHFSMVFYTTVLGVAGSICSLLGIYTYQKYASEWTFRQLLLVSNVAICILSISDVVFFLRLNVRIGIPDHAFILGSNVFASILSQLFYVAMTRARNRLVLSFSLKRDSGEAAEPSRFLFETGAMDTMDTLDLGDGDGDSGAGTKPEEPPKRRKTNERNEFFQTGLEVQRSVKEAQVLPSDTESTPSSGMQSWIPKALESEQALCASFFGTDCLQK